ncbi:MAG: PKD domain-containing protein [Opitutaceae bacterium]
MKSLTSPFTALLIARGVAATLLAIAIPQAVIAAGNPRLPADIRLARNVKSEDAIAQLGARLPDVARAYGLRGDELADLFRKQSGLWSDAQGSLLYLCEGLPVAAGTTLAGTTVASAPASTVSAATPATFTLHSTPGSTRVIYLDFTGHTTAGTPWNSNFTGGASIVSQPFDLDGDPSTFSADECAFIQRVWQRVAEDFAPFAVDVTTEDPGLEALRYSGSGDNAYGQRVVITPSNWYSTNAGGVSYVGSFNWSSETPNFVFTQQLANGEKYIAEAISHETGHALGLSHDGASGGSPTEYYAGQGDWAPIMGNSYYRSITQWCKGEYQNANNTQDQLSIMQSYGAPLLPNTFGSTLATATPISGPAFSVGGTITGRTDVDLFRFNAGAGTISLTVANLSPQPNMNIQVQLLDGAGNLVQSGGSSVANVALSANVNAGTYYLKINGSGSGDPFTNGYSNYASVGNYVLTGSVAPTSENQAPVAVANGSPTSGVAPLPVTFSSAGSSDADGSIVSYAWSFGDGTYSSEASPAHVYANTGNYTATLTVTDNGNLSGVSTVLVAVNAPANRAPIAVASGTPTSGVAPLPVSFSSAGSWDSDGSIASYRWDFGDGNSSTSPSPSKTYNAVGTYTARLTVTDNQGATNSTTVEISVGAPLVVVNPDFDVDAQSFALSLTKAASGTTGKATIFIRDRLGRPASGVSVTIQWSGLVSGNSTAQTDADGKVLFSSGRSKKAGSVTASITAITPSAGAQYDAAIYAEPTVRTIVLN